MKKVVSIVYKKIGRHKARGLAYTDTGHILIDERLRGKELLYVLVHESIHIQNPTWSEIKVIGHSEELTNILWGQGYRRVEL